jgi:predicted amidohydrolase YtcJ
VAQTERGIREMVKAFNAEGMTGGKDPGISSQTWELYRKIMADDSLSVRIFALWSGGRSVEGATRVIAEHAAASRPYESTGDDRLVSGGVKLYIDGSGGARTAWLYDDWNMAYRDVDRGNRGYPTSDADTMRLLIRQYHDAGMHVSVHAIGDRGIDLVMDSYDKAMRENPKRGLRHGIIHANIPSDHSIAVMARLQREMDAGYPEPSASFNWWLGDSYAGNFGEKRALRLNPFNTYRKNGITWANGSDFGVTPFAARYGIWSAVARETLLGTYGATPFGTAESVNVQTALPICHDLGGAADVSRHEDRIDRSGEIRRSRRVGPRFLHRPDGRDQGREMSDDGVQREGGISGRRRRVVAQCSSRSRAR